MLKYTQPTCTWFGINRASKFHCFQEGTSKVVDIAFSHYKQRSLKSSCVLRMILPSV